MSKLNEFLRKTAAHAVLSQALAAKQAEELAIHDLAHKAAMDEIDSTLDALIKVGAVNPAHKKEASAALANHSGALVHLRKLAGMVLKHRSSASVDGPGGPVVSKTAGDTVVRSARIAADDEFLASQQ